jgi:hypothetical protein
LYRSMAFQISFWWEIHEDPGIWYRIKHQDSSSKFTLTSDRTSSARLGIVGLFPAGWSVSQQLSTEIHWKNWQWSGRFQCRLWQIGGWSIVRELTFSLQHSIWCRFPVAQGWFSVACPTIWREKVEPVIGMIWIGAQSIFWISHNAINKFFQDILSFNPYGTMLNSNQAFSKEALDPRRGIRSIRCEPKICWKKMDQMPSGILADCVNSLIAWFKGIHWSSGRMTCFSINLILFSRCLSPWPNVIIFWELCLKIYPSLILKRTRDFACHEIAWYSSSAIHEMMGRRKPKRFCLRIPFLKYLWSVFIEWLFQLTLNFAEPWFARW